MKRLLTTVLLLAVGSGTAAAETLHASGPAGSSIDIVLLSEAYRADEREDFFDDCAAIIEAMKEKEPFDRYMGVINVHAGFHPAETSSIDFGGRERTRYGTYRNGSSTWINSTDARQLGVDALEAGPEADYILLVCQGSKKGGTARGRRGWVVTSAWFESVALHELGHMIGGLADEYVNLERSRQLASQWVGDPDDDQAVANYLARITARYPNVSVHGHQRERLPWNHWIDEDKKVPGGFFTFGISAFRGAYYFDRLMYRPRRGCGMSADYDDFCEPCREGLVVAFHAWVRPPEVVVTDEGDTYLLQVRPRIEGLRVEWTDFDLEGQTIRLPKSRVPSDGIALRTVDPTGWVRHPDKRAELVTTQRVSVVGARRGAAPREGEGVIGRLNDR